MQRAADAIDDGRAAALLDRWVQVSQAATGLDPAAQSAVSKPIAKADSRSCRE